MSGCPLEGADLFRRKHGAESGRCQACGPRLQVALLRDAQREAGGTLELVAGGRSVAGHLQQVRAYRGHAGDGRPAPSRPRPAGPARPPDRPPRRSRRSGSGSPSARARTPAASRTAAGSAANRCPRRAAPRRAPRRSRPGSGTARSGRSCSVAVISATPLGDRGASQQRAVLLGQRHQTAVRRRSGPAAGRRSAASAPAGRRPRRPSGNCWCSCRVSRIASAESSTRCRLGPALAVYPSLKIKYSTCRTADRRSARSSAGGSANRAPLSLIRCLARLIRWPTVFSGTSSARAISAVVRPPTARRVSATCAGAVSAGWQQSSSKVSESSTSEIGGASDPRREAPPPRAGAGPSRCATARSAGARPP